MSNQTLITKTIAGHTITLVSGRYLATRPMAETGRTDYPATIQNLGTFNVEMVIHGLEYESATELVNEFNNGAISFDGRVWANEQYFPDDPQVVAEALTNGASSLDTDEHRRIRAAFLADDTPEQMRHNASESWDDAWNRR